MIQFPGGNPADHDFYGNSEQARIARARRMRPASFSAASSTSYSTYKDIALMDASLPPTGPAQVGFATPQLMPTSLNDVDIQIEDLFNSNDPLFINPQLLDPSFENNFFMTQPNNFTSVTSDPFKSSSSTTVDTSTRNDSIQSSTIHSLQSFDDPLSPGMKPAINEDMPWVNHIKHEGPDPLQLNSSVLQTNSPTRILENLTAPISGYQNSRPSNHTTPHPQHTISPGGYPNVTSSMSPSFPEPLQADLFNYNSNSQNISNELDFSNGFWDQENNISMRSQTPSLFGNNYEKPAPRNMNPSILTESQMAASETNGNSNPSSYVITPRLRLHILTTLSTPTPFTSNQHPHLPSTPELQLYIDAYISHFAPHLPFLHHKLEFTLENAPLALSMAAIGALYLSERSHSASIFEISRCCVHVYLESRRERKLDQTIDYEVTPLWLVQALLLGVVYGLFNEEPLANEIAVAQANAVISLAKSAGLHLPPRTFISVPDPNTSSVEEKWQYFVVVQERIRTMHVVHIISCLLATGYNVISTLKNEDIRCGSPCDENLWAASSAQEWWTVLQNKESDGSLGNAVEGPDFLDCLQRLLTGNTLVGEIPQFALLTLIYAIHREIHERRIEYDHRGVRQSPQSTSPFTTDDQPYIKLEDNNEPSSIHSDQGSDTIVASLESPGESSDTKWLDQEKRRVEAILRAWETTWSLSPHASLIPRSQEGSLMSDSIPMSSLAHVRLYLDLRKTKECFWKRDFVGMGREMDMLSTPVLYEVQSGTRKQFNALLEAASYAADTISLWEKHSSRWTLQATASQTFVHNILALFDCGLIVSEFFHRLEKRASTTWHEDEKQLVSRLRKIFFRVFDVLSSRADADVLHNQQQRCGQAQDLSPYFDSPNSNHLTRNARNDSIASNMDPDSSGGDFGFPQKDLQLPLSLMSLSAVSRILSTIYIWPFALIMSQALQARMGQIKADKENNLSHFNSNTTSNNNMTYGMHA